MVSTEELRAAMENAGRPRQPWTPDFKPAEWAALTVYEKRRADTLAAAVRELYEALPDAFSFQAEKQHRAVETYNRYRAALEGDTDE